MRENRAEDAIDQFVEEWTRERPDLDFHYLATLGRILRISAYLREQMDGWLSPFGLTWEMFDLLATLQRSGVRGGLRPTDLYEKCMLSSGATTNRIDRAERLRLAARQPDREDGRATKIALTQRGHDLTRRAIAAHSTHAAHISDCLSAREREQLTRLLRKLLLRLERLKAEANTANGRKERPTARPLRQSRLPRAKRKAVA